MPKINLPDNHQWLINRMKALNYQAYEEGVCFGIANMALQAILDKKVRPYNKHFKHLYKLAPDDLKKIYQKTRNDRKEFALAQSKNLVDRKSLPISKEEEWFALLEGIECYHNAFHFRQLKEHKYRGEGQNTLLTSSLIMSRNLLDQGGLENTTTFTGAYQLNDLINYFETLEKNLQNISQPIVLLLDSSKHTATIGFDPDSKKWLFTDNRKLSIDPVDSASELAQKIINTFTKNNKAAVFQTKIFTAKKQGKEIKAQIENWQSQDVFQKIHLPTETKAAWVDAYENISWLYVAAFSGDVTTVKALLQLKANVDHATKDTYTALYIAAFKGHAEIVDILIKANASVDITTKQGIWPLYVAAQNGHIGVVNILLNAYAIKNKNINQITSEGFTELHAAAFNGNVDVVNALVKAKIDINKATKDGLTALIATAQNGYHNIVEILLKEKVELDAVDTTQTTALFFAAQNNYPDIVNALIAAGATIDLGDNNGVTPLFQAASKGNLNVVNILLSAYQKQNKNINEANKKGTTAIFIAAQNGKLETVKALINAQVDINKARNDGNTPLSIAAYHGDLNVVNALVNAKAKVNLVDNEHRTALYLAVQNNHSHIVKVLIKANASVDIANQNGATPLFLASETGYVECFNALLDAKADVNQAKKNGMTPLYIAAANNRIHFVKALLDRKADPAIAFKTTHQELSTMFASQDETMKARLNDFLKNQKETVMMRPIDMAKIMGYEEIVKLMLQYHPNLKKMSFFKNIKNKIEEYTPNINFKPD